MKGRLVLVVALIVVIAAALAATPGPVVAQVDPNPFAGVTGIRWKPGTAERDVLVTKAPYAGVTDQEATAAEKAHAQRVVAGRVYNSGVRLVTVDVSPYRKVWKSLATRKRVDGASNPCYQTETREGRADGACDTTIVEWKKDQYRAIARFIANVATDPTEQEGVGPDFRFLLHSRMNGQRAFVRDMVATINRVAAAGFDDRLAGVMIGEHEKEAAFNAGGGYLPLAVDIAEGINAGAGSDWLLNGRVLMLNGGRFGPDFNGIESGIDAYDFFTKIGSHLQYFAFTFKYYLGDKPRRVYIGTESTHWDGWEAFLKNPDDAGERVSGLNLQALHDRLSASDVPDRLNAVLFIGDSADGLYAVKTKTRTIDGRKVQAWSEEGCETVREMRRVFAEFGWNGFLFGQPLDHRDVITREFRRGMWAHGTFADQNPVGWWRSWTDPSSGEGTAHYTPCSGTTE